jgi:inorganic pyrophosphatase
LSAVILTVDLLKSDAEIKIILGCCEEELQAILGFHNKNNMRATLVRRPTESGEK